jgi:hypothetical protein
MSNFIDRNRLTEVMAQTAQMASDILLNKTEKMVEVLNLRTEAEQDVVRQTIEIIVNDLRDRAAVLREERE